MFAFIIGLALAVFIGKLAVQSAGTARTLAILNRAFWVLWLLWSALVLYGATWSPSNSALTIGLVVGPLIVRSLIVFIVRGKL